MLNLEKSYLISKLNEGESLKIIFMSHNAHWAYLEQLDYYYENCNIQVYGRGYAYIEMAQMVGRQIPMDDCDLIIYYSTDYYDEYEYNKMQKMAIKVSLEKNKKVSIGYLYHLPEEQIKKERLNHEVKIINIEKGVQIGNQTINMSDICPYELTEMTLLKHDDKERQLIRAKL